MSKGGSRLIYKFKRLFLSTKTTADYLLWIYLLINRKQWLCWLIKKMLLFVLFIFSFLQKKASWKNLIFTRKARYDPGSLLRRCHESHRENINLFPYQSSNNIVLSNIYQNYDFLWKRDYLRNENRYALRKIPHTGQQALTRMVILKKLTWDVVFRQIQVNHTAKILS